MLKMIECPRDAMQGLPDFVPTELKARYINALLKVGFDTLDFGSFVSPKAIPQLRDTAEVLSQLDLSATQTKLLAIVANQRGAEDVCRFAEIDFLGYPFSISEIFQLRNTQKTIAESLNLVQAMQELVLKNGKKLVIYISMGFGNPYGEAWSPDLAAHWVEKMADLGVEIISLADTIGCAHPESIAHLFSSLIPRFPGVEIGAHFHSTPETRIEKLEAAWNNGCRRIDSALNGFGGCPFAEDDLVGNIATESVIEFLQAKNIPSGLDKSALHEAMLIAGEVFG
ncbi:MAG: hydroxymethylglutaryl-CoA lyase [Bacteroidia bacterium]|nr:hydroxymethylglutaryl-CoA lyase [Bacteroidia bacterium]